MSNDGILWVATYGGGVNYYNSKKLPFIKVQHQLNNKNSLSSNFTRSIVKDKNGHLWFGTENGLSIWNREKNTWKHIERFNKTYKSQVIVLALEADENYIWVGTYNDGLFKININTLAITSFNDLIGDSDLIRKIYTIKKDSKGNIWVGGIEKDLISISPKNEIIKFPILHIKTITSIINNYWFNHCGKPKNKRRHARSRS